MHHTLRVLMLSTFPPTRCGIATFARDHISAMEQSGNGLAIKASVAAIDRDGDHLGRSGQIVYTVNPNRPESYHSLANFVNRSDYDVICLQHEYGLFGGDWGENLLGSCTAARSRW